MPPRTTLKRDIFGRIERDGDVVLRLASGSPVPGSGWLARRLARREQRTLARLTTVPGIPRPLGSDGATFRRTWIEGCPIHEARGLPAEYWDSLWALVGEMHDRGVAHDDLAKEANILVTPEGKPALVDFQLAALREEVGDRIFTGLCHEDRRHVLKQKRLHRPQALRLWEERILATKSLPVRVWAATAMRPWQRLVIALGWEPRSGPRDR